MREDSIMELRKIPVEFIPGKMERFTLDNLDQDILMVKGKFI